jgi:hypothetical protein
MCVVFPKKEKLQQHKIEITTVKTSDKIPYTFQRQFRNTHKREQVFDEILTNTPCVNLFLPTKRPFKQAGSTSVLTRMDELDLQLSIRKKF